MGGINDGIKGGINDGINDGIKGGINDVRTPHERAAYEGFLSGRSCAQAVFAAFSDINGISERDALMTASAFGGGIGRMRELCGALSGMLMAVGSIYGGGDDAESKSKHYARVRALTNTFRERCGSSCCRELLEAAGVEAVYGGEPDKRTSDYYEKRPCPMLCAAAARILDEYIEKDPPTGVKKGIKKDIKQSIKQGMEQDIKQDDKSDEKKDIEG